MPPSGGLPCLRNSVQGIRKRVVIGLDLPVFARQMCHEKRTKSIVVSYHKSPIKEDDPGPPSQ